MKKGSAFETDKVKSIVISFAVLSKIRNQNRFENKNESFFSKCFNFIADRYFEYTRKKYGHVEICFIPKNFKSVTMNCYSAYTDKGVHNYQRTYKDNNYEHWLIRCNRIQYKKCLDFLNTQLSKNQGFDFKSSITSPFFSGEECKGKWFCLSLVVQALIESQIIYGVRNNALTTDDLHEIVTSIKGSTKTISNWKLNN